MGSCFEDFFHLAHLCNGSGGALRNWRASSQSHGASQGKYWECGGAEGHLELLLASGAAFSWVSPGAVHPLGSGSVPSTPGSRCFELASGALHVSGAQGAIPRLGLKPLLGNHAPAFDLVSPHV